MTIPGTVECILCNSVVTYRKKDMAKFDKHMKVEHAAHYATDIILAVSMMNLDEREAVRQVMMNKEDTSEGETTLEEDVMETSSKDEEEAPDEVKKEPEEQFACQVCDKKFLLKSSLKMHKIKQHSTVNEDMIKTSKYFQSNKSILTKVRNDADIEKYVEHVPGLWKDLDNWKSYSRERKDPKYTSGVRVLRSFLTPKKTHIIHSSLGVIEYLRIQGIKSDDQLVQIAAKLQITRGKFNRLFNGYYDSEAAIQS